MYLEVHMFNSIMRFSYCSERGTVTSKLCFDKKDKSLCRDTELFREKIQQVVELVAGLKH